MIVQTTQPLIDLSRSGDYFWALLPEIFLALWAMGVLLADVFQKGNRSEPSRPLIPWLSLGGLFLTALLNGWVFARMMPGSETGTADWGLAAGPAMIAMDGVRFFSNYVILLAAGLAIVMSMGYLDRRGINRGEFHALVLFAALGMMLMAGSRDLLMVFIALELMSIAIYVLVGFDRLDARSTEGSLKYFLLGAFSSAFFLFGIALTWGATGTSDIAQIGELISGGAVKVTPMLLAGMGMLMVGFGFKVAAMPFHMWTPDAYDGAPTPVTALMSTGVKAAAFAAFIRVFVQGFGGAYEHWVEITGLLAMITMIGGNLVALTQGSVKRMLAYSSIAHAGYLLVALAAGRGSGVAAFLFYLLIYTLMTAGAFALVVANSNEHGEERVALEDWAGFAHQKPLLAAMFGVFLLSLAGFPLTAGFLGKIYILRSAVDAGLAPLAVVLVLASLLSYFYYLRVIVVMYMRPARTPDEHRHAWLPRPAMAATALAAVLVVGLFFFGGVSTRSVTGPMRWAERSAATLFSRPAGAQFPAGAPAPAVQPAVARLP
ncbi:MAG TPA: NADH-quinone oxidoreductase subunit N [Longimicrobium sp.]|nr:NADH-quinone oxidoreductase subunit N [Longimicrobium sp.]